jgi:hypothetical protein
MAASAAEIPAGTALTVRQQGAVGTRFSKSGDAVRAVLLSPILDRGRTLLPAGSELRGAVTLVRKVGLGVKHQSASLALDFRSILLPNGKELPIDTRVIRVETARERVDRDGTIHGIGQVTNISSSLAVAAWRLMVIAPGVGVPVWATKLIFAPAPDTEIHFAHGTEYRLELARPLIVDDDGTPAGLPASMLSPEHRAVTQSVLDGLPSQRAERVSGASADLVNLILVGSAADVTRAFQAAGWTGSDHKAAASVARTYFSIMLRRGYARAPMATMVLDGNRSDIELQKSLDTFSRRHHLRIWARAHTASGESIWVAASTEDTGIKFSRATRNFTHVIDGNVDAERTKVVDDLLYTGCVSEAGLIERSDLPEDLENGTGTRIQTDWRVAVVHIGDCSAPRVMPGVEPHPRTNFFRFLAASVRTELIRSNFLSLAYNGVRLTSSTRRFLFGKPAADDSGERLTRQQVEWLKSGPTPLD